MRYIIDTDWVIHWLNGRRDVIEHIKGLEKEGLSISIISMAEIYEGVHGSRDPQKHEKGFTEFLTRVIILEITEGVCKKFGELRNALRKRGELIGDFDLLIASTALMNNLVLLTDNVKHYEKIRDLKIKKSSL